MFYFFLIFLTTLPYWNCSCQHSCSSCSSIWSKL